ncbi:MAG TPA: LysR family transcriptional regulator [Chthoniobacterales bacterium]
MLIDKISLKIDEIDARQMNIHHLELFYHVAKNGGISPAVHNMPYGIQQPAMSAQILRLEEDLNTVLFQRRPFRLTNSGEKLYSFIGPFFSGVEGVAEEIRGTKAARLRLAGSAPVLRDHFPSILAAHRLKYPSLHLTLRETNQAEAECLLQQDEIDLAITELEGRSPAGVKSSVILELPLAFMVEQDAKWKDAEQLLRVDRLREPLIALPASEVITRLFQDGFGRRGMSFTTGVEVSSLESMKAYVASGFGIGLGLASPGASEDTRIRVLPIARFPVLRLGALWVGKLSPIAQFFLDAVKERAAKLSTKAASPRSPRASTVRRPV